MIYLIALLFGIVEGITEWLPVSSTGHLILLNNFVNFDVSEDFFSMFEVVIQLGAILAVVVIFWNQLWPFSTKEKYCLKMDTFWMWVKIVVACIPAGLIVVLKLDEKCEEMFYYPLPIAIALIVVGFLFIIVESLHNGEAKINNIAEITFTTALIIGMFQVVAALFPGVSRSGATIIGALLIGVSRKTAAEFTFYLAVPVMAGASLLKLLKFGFDFSSQELILLMIGCVSAFLISIVIIKFLLGYIKKHDFKAFAIYRIVLGAAIITLAATGCM